MPWDELEATYAVQFSAAVGAPAKSVRINFGALYIKQKLGHTDEETDHQIRENAYVQYFLGFAGYIGPPEKVRRGQIDNELIPNQTETCGSCWGDLNI